jgi:hypothetical protein
MQLQRMTQHRHVLGFAFKFVFESFISDTHHHVQRLSPHDGALQLLLQKLQSTVLYCHPCVDFRI